MNALELHVYVPSSSEQRMHQGLRFVLRAFVARVSDRNLSHHYTDSLHSNDSMSKCLVRCLTPGLFAQEVNSRKSEVILCYGFSIRLTKFLLMAI